GTIRASLFDDPDLVSWFDAAFADFPPSVSGPLRLRSEVMGFDNEKLHLDTDLFCVEDIAGAARLCGTIMGSARAVASSVFWSSGELTEADRLRLQLQEKEAAIQQLAEVAERFRRTIEERNQQIQEVDAQLQRLRRLTRYPRMIVRAFRAVARKLSPGKRAS